nr:PREDICTED: DNA repair protein complementing XP-C cells [Lepisosteus oculatus]
MFLFVLQLKFLQPVTSMANKRKGSVDAAAKKDSKKCKQVTKGKEQETVKKSAKKITEDGRPKGEAPKAVAAKKSATNCKKVPGAAAKTSKATSKRHRATKGVKEEPAHIKEEDDDDEKNRHVQPRQEEGSSQAGWGREGAAVMVKKEETDEDEESDEDWEDVEELNEPMCSSLGPSEPALPSQPVEIEIETPEQAKKRQRRERRKAEFETYLRRMMNRFTKDVLTDTHKVHLLCLLANGFFRNRVCSEPDLQAIALSVVPNHFTRVTPEKADVTFLSNLVKWFTKTFTLNPELSDDDGVSRQATLEGRFGMFSARDHEEMTHLFLIILRALQFFCRLVLSLQPIPLKGPPNKSKSKTSSSTSLESPPSAGKTKSSGKSLAQKAGKMEQEVESICDDENNNNSSISKAESRIAGAKRPVSQKARSGKGAKKLKPEEDAGSSCSEKQGVKKEASQKPKNERRRKVASKINYKEDSEDEDDSASEFELSSDTESSYSEGEEHGRRRSSTGKRQVPQSRTKISQAGRNKSQAGKAGKKATQKEKETLGSDNEDIKETGQTGIKGTDQWLEVYLEESGKWVCVDCVRPAVALPQLCYKQATKPVTYVVGIDNGGFVKDLTKRYDPTWMTSTRKRRVDEEWWEETLESYKSPFTERDEKEDMELQAKLLDQPLPTAISEYKSHPLYALKRHLLKYEALYPPTAAILGYCRGEAVYSRDCVHTLHSKDTWLKEARVVRLGEVPYKMVKGFSNRARKARLLEAENRNKVDLPLFGHWQTEEYQPPVAVDGKVPRNEYGNVYLFRPCMLPIGCVHLQVPNLHRVARKLNIDCAPAVTGFDFHCGFSHPVIEGYVACEEYKEVLLAAWENEQAELEKKEREKREKRVLSNWTLLVKGLLIRERLKRRYGKQSVAEAQSGEANVEGDGFSSEEEEAGSLTAATDLTGSWPQNRQAGQEDVVVRKSKRERRGQQKHLFPFEKI